MGEPCDSLARVITSWLILQKTEDYWGKIFYFYNKPPEKALGDKYEIQ